MFRSLFYHCVNRVLMEICQHMGLVAVSRSAVRFGCVGGGARKPRSGRNGETNNDASRPF